MLTILYVQSNSNDGPKIDMYNEEDSAEEEDTRYVVDQLRHSRESLKVCFLMIYPKT